MKLSVILPTYNEAQWLKQTLTKLNQAIEYAKLSSAEIIVIDDGSTDNTEEMVKALSFPSLKYIKQDNKGRFLARKKGIEAAHNEYILFIDSRVHISKKSLLYVKNEIKKTPANKVWNAHVIVEKKNNPFARFWDVITCIAWRRYFANPRRIAYGVNDFDYYPKGTTCFIAPKKTIIAATKSFDTKAVDMKKANDDTLLIKNIAKQHDIHISPNFSCTYHARGTLKKFLSHAYHRGQVFVDGFLHPGNRYFYPLVGFFGLCLIGVISILIMPTLALFIPLVVLAFALFCGAGSALFRIPAISFKDSIWFGLLAVPFAIFYGMGLWRAFLVRLSANDFFRAGLIYLVAVLVYFRDLLGSLNTRVLEAPGDAVGLMWLNQASPSSPWWSTTQWTNYPLGEYLWQPLFLISQLFYIPYWFFSKLVGSVAAYHVLMGIGFIFSALVMFGLVRWIMQRQVFIAPLFAGFALSFMPFLLIKAAHHPSYVFNGVLTGLLWILLIYALKKRTKFVILAGIIVGLTFYFDPYFVLLSSVIYGGFWLSLLIKLKFNLVKFFKQHAKNLLFSISTIILIAVPMLYIYVSSAQEIKPVLSEARGDIVGDARAFSARPWEFFLPAFYNPLLPTAVKNFQMSHFHGSNITENVLFLGFSVILLALIGFVGFVRNKIRVRNGLNKNFVLISILVIGVIALLLSLPPYVDISSQRIYLPSYLLVQITETWRVLSRLVIIVQIAMAILAAFGLQYVLDRLKSRIKKIAVTFIVFIFLACEFFVYLPVWSFETSQPIYNRIKSDQSVTALAEYPLLDPPQASYFSLYTAYQLIHRKPIVNSSLAYSSNEAYRDSIQNLRNWQTLPVLRSMEVNMVILHGENLKQEPKSIPGLKLYGSSFEPVTRDGAWSYKVENGKKVECIVTLKDGFDGPSTTGFDTAEYYMHQYGNLYLNDIPGDQSTCSSQKKVTLELYTFEKQNRSVKIVQNSRVLWSGITFGSERRQQVSFLANTNDKIEILPQNPPDKFSLVISNMIAE